MSGWIQTDCKKIWESSKYHYLSCRNEDKVTVVLWNSQITLTIQNYQKNFMELTQLISDMLHFLDVFLCSAYHTRNLVKTLKSLTILRICLEIASHLSICLRVLYSGENMLNIHLLREYLKGVLRISWKSRLFAWNCVQWSVINSHMGDMCWQST